MTLLPILSLITITSLPLYLVRFHIGPLPVTVLEILLLATILALGIQKIKKYHLRKLSIQQFFHSPLSILISAFLLAATISIFVAPSLRNALGIWKAYFIEPVLFFFVLTGLVRQKKISFAQIITTLGITAIALSLYAMFQRSTGFGIPPPWDIERRVTSIFPYPNALALFLAPLIPLFVGQIFQKNIPWKVYYALATLLSLIAIFFAHSTGALLGLATGLFAMGLLYLFTRRQKFYILHSTFIILIPILAGIILLTTPSLKPVRDEILLRDWSGRVHKTVWQESWSMIKAHPIAGTGLSGYQTAFKPFHKATYIEIFQYPHNIILNFWSETGLFGVISFLGLVVYFFVVTFNKLHTPKHALQIISIIAAMIVILVHGLVDVPYFKNDLAVLFWVIYALGATI